MSFNGSKPNVNVTGKIRSSGFQPFQCSNLFGVQAGS